MYDDIITFIVKYYCNSVDCTTIMPTSWLTGLERDKLRIDCTSHNDYNDIWEETFGPQGMNDKFWAWQTRAVFVEIIWFHTCFCTSIHLSAVIKTHRFQRHPKVCELMDKLGQCAAIVCLLAANQYCLHWFWAIFTWSPLPKHEKCCSYLSFYSRVRSYQSTFTHIEYEKSWTSRIRSVESYHATVSHHEKEKKKYLHVPSPVQIRVTNIRKVSNHHFYGAFMLHHNAPSVWQERETPHRANEHLYVNERVLREVSWIIWMTVLTLYRPMLQISRSSGFDSAKRSR